MKRLIAFISILMLVSLASGTAVSITIYGTNKSNAQTNITCYGCNNTISVQAWNTSYVKNISVHSRNASGDVVSFNISNVTAYRVTELKVNGTAVNAYQAGANGMLNFSYNVTGNKTLTLSPAVNANGYNFTWLWTTQFSGMGFSASGNFGGDATVNRAIAHGLGRTPNGIFLFPAGAYGYVQIFGTTVRYVSDAALANLTVTTADSTNFYVGNATDPIASGNGDARIFQWVAI